MINDSIKPIDKTTINNIKTYFGAFEVIKKILFGLKSLNIFYFYEAFSMKDVSDQECRGR